MLQLLFVDGIGGRPLFRAPFLKQLAGLGLDCHYFDYRPSRESITDIRIRLERKLDVLASNGQYLLVGYSFGGILARLALAERRTPTNLCRLILVASPMRSLALCRRFSSWRAFHWLTGDCGALAASDLAMASIPAPNVPTTCVYGTRSVFGFVNLTGSSQSDGMVSVSEVNPALFSQVEAQPTSHPFMATSRNTFEVISTCVAAHRRGDA